MATTRKHITTACTACRSRKIKCDGQNPACSNCQAENRECDYRRELDKRKTPLRKTVDQLTARVQLLEGLLRDNNIPFPAAAAEDGERGATSGNAQIVPAEQSQANRGSETPAPQADTGELSFDWADLVDGRSGSLVDSQVDPRNNSGNRDILDAGIPFNNGQAVLQHYLGNSDGQPENREDESSEEECDIVDKLGARIGSFQIAEDGQWRYFGATSNLHILHSGLFSLSRPSIRSVRNDGIQALLRAKLDSGVTSQIESSLEQLYFTWEDPAIHVVDEEMYYEAKKEWLSGVDGSPFYSDTLKNAICAIGAMLYPGSVSGVPEPAGEFFGARAKVLLDIEMDSPNVATVQALVILSAVEAAYTRDARGWLYSGMAGRLSADLGLHLDLGEEVRDQRMTAREVSVRQTTFWGVFIHYNMWSLYVGRPWGMDIRDITVARPSGSMPGSLEKNWKMYSASESSSFERSQFSIADPICHYAASSIRLAEMMRDISHKLYADRTTQDHELRQFAGQMRQQCKEWRMSLPLELQIDISQPDRQYLPHVLQLHMQLEVLLIFIHRPFFSLRMSLIAGEAPAESIEARRQCIQAAQSIVRIIKIYRKQYTLRRTNVQMVHLIFTASLIHIYRACVSSGLDLQQAIEDLQDCCQALNEIGQTYKNSLRALEVVICLKQEWQSRFPHTGSKRRSSFGAAKARRLSEGKRKKVSESTGQPEFLRHGPGQPTSAPTRGLSADLDGFDLTNDLSQPLLDNSFYDFPSYSYDFFPSFK